VWPGDDGHGEERGGELDNSLDKLSSHDVCCEPSRDSTRRFFGVLVWSGGNGHGDERGGEVDDSLRRS
jgi:hypothetical protein